MPTKKETTAPRKAPAIRSVAPRHRKAAAAAAGGSIGTLAEIPEPNSEDIARLAYSIWEERQGQEGSAEQDWLRAEELLRNS